MDSWGVGLWALGFGPWSAFGLVVYVAGVVWGLVAIDARPAARIGLALVWPLGPLAFVVTIAILLAASLVAFPLFGLAVLAAAGVVWWILT